MICGVTVQEIIWTGGLPHLRGLLYLPGFPHHLVNRPLDGQLPQWLALQRASNGPPSRDYSNISPRLKPFIQILTQPKYAYDRSFTHHQNTVLFFFNVSNRSKLCRVSY